MIDFGCLLEVVSKWCQENVVMLSLLVFAERAYKSLYVGFPFDIFCSMMKEKRRKYVWESHIYFGTIKAELEKPV